MRASAWLAGAALLLFAAGASAHIPVGARTLRELVAESDLVLRGRIESSGERVGLSTEGGSASRPTVEARVLEVLKGDLGADRVRFAQHGHGVATFEPGSESLLFLRDIAKIRELRALGEAGALDWVSLQEHEERYPLQPETRDAMLGAVRDYVAAGSAPPAERLLRLRAATLTLLSTPDADLAASAIRDLVAAPELALIDESNLPTLRAVLDDAAVSMGVRTALLAALEGRGLLDGGPLWLAWLSEETPDRDRITALRASRSARDPEVRRRVRALLGDSDAGVAAAAVEALAVTTGADAVPDFAEALAHTDSRVRYAAIRALGRVATPAALRALRETAEAHADEATRRRARAELRKRSQTSRAGPA